MSSSKCAMDGTANDEHGAALTGDPVELADVGPGGDLGVTQQAGRAVAVHHDDGLDRPSDVRGVDARVVPVDDAGCLSLRTRSATAGGRA